MRERAALCRAGSCCPIDMRVCEPRESCRHPLVARTRVLLAEHLAETGRGREAAAELQRAAVLLRAALQSAEARVGAADSKRAEYGARVECLHLSIELAKALQVGAQVDGRGQAAADK